MAEATLLGLAGTVLTQFQSLALDEFQLLWDHKEQFRKLENTITTITNVLQDAEIRKSGDFAVQGWLARLKIVLYKADDLFDKISHKILHEKANKKSKVVKEVRNLAFFVKIAHKVKDIRGSLDDIAKDINQFNFLPNQVDHDRLDRIGREQTHSYVPTYEVEGRERERNDLVKMLLKSCEEQRGVRVVAVIGIGGLGKTTLAQVVYNDQRVQQGFDLSVWACINYFTHLNDVLVDIVKSTTEIEPKSLILDQLQSCLRQKIKGKRFLLVLDDVRDDDPQSWHKLKILLDDGKEGSLVLVTTRSVKVAQSMHATEPYYHLRGLSDHSAWLLFKKIAFVEEGEQHGSYMEKLGRDIVNKCANVPLAIVTIANLLRYKEKKKWFPLVNHELSKVVPSEYDKVIQVLKMSYNDLPYHVKRCFAYCSLFPKGYEFEKDEIVRLWIAQGFVESSDVSQSLEDRAAEYFFCLRERCFFQYMKMSKNQGVKRYTWKMNNLVLDLAKSVAKSENILVHQITHDTWDKTLLHMSLSCELESLVGHFCSFSHSKSLRTFICLHKSFVKKDSLNKLLSSFKAIRVLDLSDLGIKDIPACIGELIHLRFLDLSKNEMERLPSSVYSLHHLQTLILRGCEHLKELPSNIDKLLSLRYLEIKDCNELSHLPSGLIALDSLMILKVESCQRCVELPPISHLPSLKELYLQHMSSMLTIENNKLYSPGSFFPSLETLWIWNMPNLKSWWLQEPTVLHTFPRLTKVNIHNCPKLTSCMPLFPVIEHLKLESIQKDLIWHNIRRKSNNVVKRLRIARIRGLRSIAEEQTISLSNLQKLSIFRCEQLVTISCKAISHLTSMEKLKITGCEKLEWIDVDDQKPQIPWGHFPRLKYLEIPITNINLLTGLRYLTSLKILKIYTFNQEIHLVKEVKCLTSLQELTISKCKELYMSWRVILSLQRLQILTFSSVEKVINDDDSAMVETQLSCLREMKIYNGSAEWLCDIPWNYLKCLHYLHLSGLINLHGLPEGVKHLTSLQQLKIMVCKSVLLLPRWIKYLSSLRYLEIRGSSEELKKRCKEGLGKDWPNIQHIEEIIIS